MEVAFTPNANEHDLQSASLFPNASEQYVTVTYNNSTLAGILYTNGVLDASTILPNTTYSPGSIGGAGGTTDDWLGNNVFGDPQFNGTIYEFRIWNGAVTPLYVAVSAAAGPSVVVTNLTPTLVTLTVTNTTMIGAQTQQATVAANFAAASGVTVTGAATNWTSSNPNVLTVSSTGFITALSGGSATVSATVGGVTASSASITVQLTVPVITQQPSPVAAVVGESATFTVAALGGNLTYQWSDGVTPISGATNATLTLNNLTLGQSGNYSVQVTNALGGTNSVAVMLSVETSILAHRYSFVSDASDSVGGANGTLVAGNNPATISNGLNLPGTGKLRQSFRLCVSAQRDSSRRHLGDGGMLGDAKCGKYIRGNLVLRRQWRLGQLRVDPSSPMPQHAGRLHPKWRRARYHRARSAAVRFSAIRCGNLQQCQPDR